MRFIDAFYSGKYNQLEMNVAGRKFHFICNLEPIRELDRSVRQFMPQNRNRNHLELHTYGNGPFCKFKIESSLDACGVYLLVLTVDDQVQYVGGCANLSKAVNHGFGNISPRNCFKGGQETNCRLNHLIYTAATTEKHIALWFSETSDYKAVKRSILEKLNPPWNL